jgi:hypothetical protein
MSRSWAAIGRKEVVRELAVATETMETDRMDRAIALLGNLCTG